MSKAQEQRSPEIQGLRAVAIIGVLVFHTFPRWLPGGFVGVDVFFVISGYVISRSLLREKQIDLLPFYYKRARRILPALLVVLAASLVAGWFVLSPVQFRELARSGLAATVFLNNLDAFRNLNYFDTAAEYKPLLHLWSLSVEEQFYLAFPFFLAAIRSRLLVGRVLLAVSAASLAFAVWAGVGHPMLGFFSPFSRVYEFILGVAVAAIPRQFWPQWIGHPALSYGGLSAILLSYAAINSGAPFPAAVALLPCSGAALTILADRCRSGGYASPLQTRPMVFTGDISYSLYLWHWPIIVFARHVTFNDMSPVAMFAALSVSFFLAWLSYSCVERPVLNARDGRAVVAGLLVASAGVGVANATIYRMQGAALRFDERANIAFSAAALINPRRPDCHNSGLTVSRYSDACVFGVSHSARDLAVWSDSHGAELAFVLGLDGDATHRAVRQLTSSACPPVKGYDAPGRPFCRLQNDEYLRGLIGDKAVGGVVVIANFQQYPAEDWNRLRAGYRGAVLELVRAGKKVWISQQLPIMPYDPPSAIGRLIANGRNPETFGLARADFDRRTQQSRTLIEELAAIPNVRMLDPSSFLCDERICRAHVGTTLYFDPSHLNLTGAKRLAAEVAW